MFELRERDREDDSGLGWAGADTPATPSTRPSSFVRLDARSRAVSAALGRAWKKPGLLRCSTAFTVATSR